MTWQCMRTGECCERVERVVMTFAERRELQARADELEIRLQWRVGERPSFTSLVARPCPFLTQDDLGRAVCRAHDVRPYNCRRFMCGRFDTTERHDVGVVNGIPLRVRQSETLRDEYAANQREAQVWADAHGWKA